MTAVVAALGTLRAAETAVVVVVSSAALAGVVLEASGVVDAGSLGRGKGEGIAIIAVIVEIGHPLFVQGAILGTSWVGEETNLVILDGRYELLLPW